MILGLLWMAVANAAVLLASHAILRHVRTGEGFLDAALFLVIRFVLASSAVLLAGLSGILTPTALGLLSLAVLCVLLARGEHRRLPQLTRPDSGRFLAVLLVITALRLLAQVWIFAPSDTDPLSYHLPKVAEWIRAGAIHHDLGTDLREAFPAGFELLETWWVVFLRHDVGIELAGVEYLLLGFLATAALAKSAGLKERSCLLAGLLFALAPGIQLMATGCMNDGAVAALLVLAAALAHARAHPLLLAVVAGLGLGVKPTTLYALPGLLLILRLAPKENRTESPSRGWAAGLALASLAGGLFWYARNAVVFGSLTYPLGRFTQLRGLQAPGEIPGSTLERLRILVETGLYDSADPVNTQLIHNAGWGPAVFVCGLVALLLAVRSDPKMRRLAAGFGVAMIGILALAPPSYHFQRFILFMPALFAVAVARLAETLPSVGVLARLALVVSFLSGIIPNTLGFHGAVELARTPWRERAADLRYRGLPVDRTVGTFLGMEGNSYSAYGPDFRRPVFTLRDAASREELLAALRDRGIRTVRVPGIIESARLKAIVLDCIDHKDLVRLPSRLYEVRERP